MSSRLARTEARVGTLSELGSVTAAMQGIAAARSHDAQRQVAGVDRHLAIIGRALADLLAWQLQPTVSPAGATGRTLTVLVSCQGGFVGSLNERLVASARQPAEPSARCLLVGERGMRVAGEQGLAVAWYRPMVGQAAMVPALARELGDQLLAMISAEAPSRLALVHGKLGPDGRVGITRRSLLPLDVGGFAGRASARRPRIQLAPELLMEQLTVQFLQAGLHAALLHGLLAENAARAQAMAEIHGNLERKLEQTRAQWRALRQEEITAEILELARRPA